MVWVSSSAYFRERLGMPFGGLRNEKKKEEEDRERHANVNADQQAIYDTKSVINHPL